MYLAFVDESDKGDLFVLAAVVAKPEVVKRLSGELDRIARDLPGSFGVGPDAEFHAYDMFHGTGAWSGVPVKLRIDTQRRVLQAVMGEDVRIVLRGVSRSRLLRRQEAKGYPVRTACEEECFKHILQRVDEIATRDGALAMVICDERSDRDRHRDRFKRYQREGTPGRFSTYGEARYMGTDLPALIDTVHFAPSDHSRIIQAADLLAFFWRRRIQVPVEHDPQSERAMANFVSIMNDPDRQYSCGMWP